MRAAAEHEAREKRDTVLAWRTEQVVVSTHNVAHPLRVYYYKLRSCARSQTNLRTTTPKLPFFS